MKKDNRAKKKNKFYSFMKKLLGGICRMLFRIKIVNPEKEVMDKTYIVCCNHTSFFDVVIISAIMKNQVSYMAKKELFKVPILSWFIKGMGAFPVDRKHGDVFAIKRAIERINDGACVGIFPQGTRCPKVDPKETEVKDGLGMIANKTGVGILPVYIKNKSRKTKMFRRNYLIIGDYIPPEEIDFSDKGFEKYKKISEYAFAKSCSLENTEVRRK